MAANTKNSFPINFIQLFADGGAAAGSAGDGAPVDGGAAQQQTTGVKTNPLADVKYGKQEPSPAAGETTTVSEDRNTKFEALIKGEYKDLYDARIQETVRKRLAGNEAAVKKYNALAPVLDLLTSKYGVNADDTEALAKAIEDDETYYEDEAMESGKTVREIKELRKMKRENAALKEQLEERNRAEKADATMSAWMAQADEVKGVYPNFDFKAELQNEQFKQLLLANIPVRTAFEVVHKDEIIPAAMQYAAAQAEQKVANSVRAGKSRPTEGAAGGNGAVQVKSDPSRFTKADIDEIARRVARGEKIYL